MNCFIILQQLFKLLTRNKFFIHSFIQVLVKDLFNFANLPSVQKIALIDFKLVGGPEGQTHDGDKWNAFNKEDENAVILALTDKIS